MLTLFFEPNSSYVPLLYFLLLTYVIPHTYISLRKKADGEGCSRHKEQTPFALAVSCRGEETDDFAAQARARERERDNE